MSNNPFDIGTPSIFVICSPFQALCAIEAIHEFKITQYKFVLCLIDDIRNEQLFNLMNKYNVSYVIEWIQDSNLKKELLKAATSKKTQYHRAFIGDYDSFILNVVAAKFLARNSQIVYLDDGTRVIPYLTGKFKTRLLSKNNIALRVLYAIRNIKDKKHFFTLFGDIALSKFICKTNNFNHLNSLLKQSDKGKDVYIIGTNIDIYCQKLVLDKDVYKKYLNDLFCYLERKYPNERKVYIQHGRDKNTFIKELCDVHRFDCIRPEITVELLIMELANTPSAIYAYTSTALFNLKKIYPNISIYNILPQKTQSVFYDVYMEYSSYFEKHGVINISQEELC